MAIRIINSSTVEETVCHTPSLKYTIDFVGFFQKTHKIEFEIIHFNSRDEVNFSILLVFLGICYLVSSYFFFKRRHLEPIRSRHPNLAFIQATAWVVFSFWTNSSLLRFGETPCFAMTIVPQLIISVALATFVVRMLVLKVDCSMASSSIKFHDGLVRVGSQKNAKNLEFVSEDWWIAHRHWFKEKKYVTFVGAVVVLYSFPLMIGEASIGSPAESRLAPDCLIKILMFGSIAELCSLIAHVVVAVIILLIVRGIDENLGIRKECLFQLVIVSAAMLEYIPLALGFEARKALLHGSCYIFGFNGWFLTYQWFTQLLFVFFSLTWPVLQTYHKSLLICKTAARRGLSNAPMPSNREYTCTAPTKDLLWLLSSPEGFELFKKRLQEELSVENILFW
jgi:hypothetical protein